MWIPSTDGRSREAQESHTTYLSKRNFSKEHEEGRQTGMSADDMGGSSFPSIRSAELVPWQPYNSCGPHFGNLRANAIRICAETWPREYLKTVEKKPKLYKVQECGILYRARVCRGTKTQAPRALDIRKDWWGQHLQLNWRWDQHQDLVRSFQAHSQHS